MNSFFVGDKRKPSFLVEVIKKQKQITKSKVKFKNQKKAK